MINAEEFTSTFTVVYSVLLLGKYNNNGHANHYFDLVIPVLTKQWWFWSEPATSTGRRVYNPDLRYRIVPYVP